MSIDSPFTKQNKRVLNLFSNTKYFLNSQQNADINGHHNKSTSRRYTFIFINFFSVMWVVQTAQINRILLIACE